LIENHPLNEKYERKNLMKKMEGKTEKIMVNLLEREKLERKENYYFVSSH
jgi:hypothetical protein